jgi:hypothetical protein
MNEATLPDISSPHPHSFDKPAPSQVEGLGTRSLPEEALHKQSGNRRVPFDTAAEKMRGSL